MTEPAREQGNLWNRLPIRARLTAWYAASLSAMIFVFGLSIDGLMHDRLMTRTDAELDEELHELALEIEMAADRDDLLRQLDLRFGRHETFDFVVQTHDGDCVFSSRRLRDVPTALARTRAGVGTSHSSAALDGVGRCRIGARAVRGPDGPMSMAVVAPLSRYLAELQDLRWLLATVGPLVVLIALFGGWWLARRSLSPVDAMTAAAARITSERLGERLTSGHSEDELGRLASTLNAMLDRLQRSLDDTRRFTADAAHELRTPLAVIRSTAEVALRSRRSEEEYADCLHTVLDGTERLTSLSNQLLILAREDAGLHEEPQQSLDLAQVIQETAADLEPLAELRGVRLYFDQMKPTPVLADRERMRRVFVNLLDNAIKYTPGGGEVRLAIGVRDGRAEVLIRDTGIGIAAQHLPHIFDRFYRADASHDRATGGTGLGLAICRAIVASHRGEIQLSSEWSVGTEVRVILPTGHPTDGGMPG